MKKAGKFLALSLLGLFLFSILAAVLVSAESTPEAANREAVAEGTTSLWTSIFGEGPGIIQKLFGKEIKPSDLVESGVLKLLVFFLIFLIILGVSDVIPFLDGNTGGKRIIRFLVSAIVAYIAVLFIAPAELWGALSGYGVMAVTLTAIIPFVIILTMYYKLSTDPTPERILLARMIGIFFAVYLFFKLIISYAVSQGYIGYWVTTETATSLRGHEGYAIVIYGLMLLIMIFIIWKDERIRHYFLKTKMKGYIAQSELMQKADITARIQALNEKIALSLLNNGAPKSKGGPNDFVDVLINAKEALEDYAKHGK